MTVLLRAEARPVATWQQAGKLLDYGFAMKSDVKPVGQLVERAPGVLAKAVVVEVLERRADDPVVLGHQTHLLEVEEAGDQLAAGEVAGRAEQHDHVRRGARQPAGALPIDIGRSDGHGTWPTH